MNFAAYVRDNVRAEARFHAKISAAITPDRCYHAALWGAGGNS